MINTLQKKFIATAMIAISVLILVLLGGINIANAFYSSRQTDELLEVISQKESSIPMSYSSLYDGLHGFLQSPITEDTAMSAVYFVVKSSSSGSLIKVDLTKIASVSEEKALEIAKKAFNNSDLSGKIDGFKYNICPSSDGGITAIFLDVSSQAHDVFRIFVLSVLGGAVCWLLMLLLVIKLSKKAILPIAKNFEQQRQFVTDAGHEIKTPLAIIMANTEAMELYTGGNKWTENIKGQVMRLNGLMQNLLALAKLDESKDNITYEDVILSDIVKEEVDSFEEPAKLKKIVFNEDIQPDVTCKASEQYISRLVSILLDNAVKYALEETEVDVILKKIDNSIVFQVRNKCNNLTENDISNLFDRFYRADSARTQKNGGYGIGLSAAKAISDLHGGSLTAKLEDEETVVFEFKM